MSATVTPNCKTTTTIGKLVFVSPLDKEGTGPVQETIWHLQDEVRVLQAELARTRRALEQRAVLLENYQQRELELRAEGGAGAR